MLQSTTGVVSLGQWTSDSKSCEYLLRNTAPEEVYMPGSSVPPFLMSNIEQFISCWKDAERYELEKVKFLIFFKYWHILKIIRLVFYPLNIHGRPYDKLLF